MTRKPTSGVPVDFATLRQKVQGMLAQAADRWRTADRVDDVSLRPAQTIVKRSCQGWALIRR